MKNIGNFFQIIAGLSLVGFTGWLLFILASTLVKYITLVSPNIIAAIIAGLVTVIGYFITRNFERRKIIEQQIREKKLPVYEEFISFLFDVLKSSNSTQQISAEEMNTFIVNFNKKSIVWLSDDSLRAFLKWKNASIPEQGNQNQTIQYLFILEQLLLEFRKDIGHKNKNFKKGDLLKLFINDMDKYID